MHSSKILSHNCMANSIVSQLHYGMGIISDIIWNNTSSQQIVKFTKMRNLQKEVKMIHIMSIT